MNFLFVAIPVIVAVVGITFVIVMLGDSNKHVKNMDTASQLELERNKEAALEEVKKIKARGFVPEESVETTEETEIDLNSKVNTQAEEIEKLRAELEELKKNARNSGVVNIVSEKKSIIEFSKESLVRGLVTKEYLQKKDRR
ncbi:MAG: hypothetical protein Q3988_05425 [Gemella sp.]|nr:hypothetical protein [Gemella sp.]